MRYHHKQTIATNMYGQIYFCDHPVYDSCTLYLINNKGLAVIQQHYRKRGKLTYWSYIDYGLSDELYLTDGFFEYFNKHAGTCTDGLYPTVTIRQIMWALKMKPLKRKEWETVFDKSPI